MSQGKMTITDDQIITEMQEQGDPAYTTAEVGEMIGMSTEGARNRLEKLEECGRVMSKKPSTRTVLWWLPEVYGKLAFSAK